MALEDTAIKPEPEPPPDPSWVEQLHEQAQPPPQAQPGQQPPDPNAPGGGPPDPRSFQLSQTNRAQPMQVASLTPMSPVPEPPVDDQGWWRKEQQQPNIYIPPSPNRSPQELGTKDWQTTAAERYPGVTPGPYYPSLHESYPAITGASSSLQAWGSPEVAEASGRANFLLTPLAAIADAFSKGKFSFNFSQAYLRGLAIQQQEGMMATERAIQLNMKELSDLGTVFYEADKGVISAEEARRRIREYAPNDRPLQEMLNSNDLKGAWNFLQWRDAQMRKQLAGYTQLKKAVGQETDEDLNKSWGEPGGAGADEFTHLPGKTSEIAPTTPGGGGEEQPKSGQPESLAGVSNDDFLKELIKREHATPQEMEAAEGLILKDPTEEYGNLVKTKTQRGHELKAKIDGLADAINNRIHRIGTNKGLTTDQKIAELEKFSPRAADIYKGLGTYETNPKSEQMKNRRHFIDTTRLFYPHYKEGNYDIVQKWHNATAGSPAATLSRVASLLPAANGLHTSLLRIPPDVNVFANKVKAFYQGQIGGADPYAQIFANVYNVNSEVSAIMSNTGRPAVAYVKERTKHMLETMSPRQINVQLQADLEAAYGNVRNKVKQFRVELNDPTAYPPFFPKEDADQYRAILRGNPHTGVMPSDAPGSVLAGSRSPTAAVPADVKAAGEDWKPLTQKQVENGRLELHDPANIGSTDPRVQAALQRIRQRLGIFADED